MPSGRVARVRSAGVGPRGALEIPADPAQVGWWTGGARAGEPFGGVVLAGHVDSAGYGIGVMAEMIRMRPGQRLEVTADAGRRQAYRVERVWKVNRARIAADTELFDQDRPHRLVLITCGGPFDRRAQHYRDNVIVTAVPVG